MPPAEEMAAALPAAAREIEEFIASAGWDQPTQMFALVDTQELLRSEPGIDDRVDAESTLTPIAQDELPSEDLAEALTRIVWPERVVGCALAQEIVVLPPEAEQELPADDEAARNAAAEDPRRHEARLVAAVLRDGTETCVMRVRPNERDEIGDGDPSEEQVVQDSELAPNLLRALHQTFA